MHALPFGKLRLTAKKPLDSSYPKTLTTRGDHVRKHRLDLERGQSSLFIRLRVDKSFTTNWAHDDILRDVLGVPLTSFRFISKNR